MIMTEKGIFSFREREWKSDRREEPFPFRLEEVWTICESGRSLATKELWETESDLSWHVTVSCPPIKTPEGNSAGDGRKGTKSTTANRRTETKTNDNVREDVRELWNESEISMISEGFDIDAKLHGDGQSMIEHQEEGIYCESRSGNKTYKWRLNKLIEVFAYSQTNFEQQEFVIQCAWYSCYTYSFS